MSKRDRWTPITVERHCPVPKGLRQVTRNGINEVYAGRKTLPCSKGIETYSKRYYSTIVLVSKDIALFQRD